MAYKNLSERLQYFGIEAHDPAHKGVSKALDRRLERALDAFYKELKSRDELMAKFSSQQSVDNARAAQERHWKAAFTDGITDVFRDRAGHIGQVHARIGLEPKWYVGSYARLLEHLVEEIIAPGWQRYLPWRRARVRQVNALVKVSLLDIELALSSYFFDLKGKVSAVNEGLGSALAKLADGNLDIPSVTLPPEYHQIEGDFNSTIDALKTTIGAAIHNVASIRTGSAEIRSASNDLARRTEQQAASLEETASAIAETAEQTQETAVSTQLARETIAEANQKAKDGAGIVAEAVTAMDQIEKSSKEITDIISVIDAIAFQTNLLALNAGVEAARAGESGKGFAVVASEVRALAQRCTEAADQVKTLISSSAGHVTSGVSLVQRSGEAFSAITQAVSDLRSSIDKIAESSEIQAQRLSQINATVRDLDHSTQQNAAMAEESNAAASSLAQQAERLRDSIGHFKVDGARAGESPGYPASLAA